METFKQTINRTLWRWGVGLAVTSLALLAVTGLNDRAMQSQTTEEAQKTCISKTANNYCAPPLSKAVREVMEDLERHGLTCSKKPSLSDHIIFQHRSGAVEVVTFAQARRLGEKSAGWVQMFCK